MNHLKLTIPGVITIVVGTMLFPGSGSVQGGIVITKSKVQEIADPTFTYTFTVEIDDDCVLQQGNFFTVFDLFAPPDVLALPDHPPTAPPGWVFSAPAVGPSPFPPSPLDTAILNGAWTYFGPNVAGPFFVGEFTVTIVQDAPKLPEVAWVSECGPLGNTTSEMGFVAVQFVPEPATIWSLAGGIGLLVVWRRRSAYRAATA
jgi:hypothetical protein